MEGFQLSQLAIGVKTLLYTGLQAVFVVLLYDQFAFTVEVLLGAISFAVTEMLIAQQYPFVVERLTLALALTRAVCTFERQFAAWVLFEAFAVPLAGTEAYLTLFAAIIKKALPDALTLAIGIEFALDLDYPLGVLLQIVA